MATNNPINAPKPFAVGIGGTGDATLTDRSVLIGRGTSPVEFAATQANSNAVLMSQGAAVNPAFTTTGTPLFNSVTYPSAYAGQTSSTMSNFSIGTFTPVLSFGGLSTGIVYGTRIGRFYVIGKIVICNFGITLTNKGSAVGAAQVSGFPIAAQASGAGYWSTLLDNSEVTYDAGYTGLSISPKDSSTIFDLAQYGSTKARAAISDANFINTSYLFSVLIYGID